MRGSSLISIYTDKNKNRTEAVEVYGAEDSTTYQYDYQSIYDHMTDHSDAFSGLSSKNPRDKFVGTWDRYYTLEDDILSRYDNSRSFEIFDDGTLTVCTDNNHIEKFTYEINENNPSQIIVKDSESDDSIVLSIDEDGIINYVEDGFTIRLIRE